MSTARPRTPMLVALGLFLIGVAGIAHASERPSADSTVRSSSARILVLDLAPVGNTQAVANRIFSFELSDSDAKVQKLLGLLDSLPTRGSTGVSEALMFLRNNAGHLAGRSSSRWVSTKGGRLFIFVFHPVDRAAKLDLAESARKTRLASDFMTLVQLGQKISPAGGRDERVPAHVTVSRYALTKRRANFSVTATLGPPANSQALRPAAQAADDAPSELKTTLVTGPREHLFLSANGAFTKVRQVKYNEASKTLEPDKKPSEFLVGFNFAFDDLFSDEQSSGAVSFARGLFLGAVVEGSKRPFNQIGAVVGLRRNLPSLDSFITFNTVSPYLGMIWARNDERTDTSTGIVTRYGKRHFVWGLSLNLDKALGWVAADG